MPRVGRRRRKRPQLERWRTISGTLVGIMGIQEVRDVTPILHALFRTAFQGRGIDSQLLARLPALADPEQPIPAWTEASADRAGGCLVVLANGWRILGLQGLRRRWVY